MSFTAVGTKVATALIVYGIETQSIQILESNFKLLQQSLPFTVLKLKIVNILLSICFVVATALTVYGIETRKPTHHEHYNISL